MKGNKESKKEKILRKMKEGKRKENLLIDRSHSFAILEDMIPVRDVRFLIEKGSYRG